MRAAKGKSPVACGHYPAWLAYAHLQLGQTAAAKSLLSACRAAAAIEKPADEPGHVMDADASLGSEFANMRLVYLLASGDWRGEVAAWELPPIVGTAARLDFAFARAVASIGGDAEEIRRAMADLEAVGREVIAAEKAKDEADPSYRVRPEIFRLEAGALLAESRRDFAAAEKLAREAVALEDALPVAFGPPTIDLPARELLGNFLLRRGRRDEARDEFARALALAPGRRAAQVGLATAAGVDAAGATTPAGGR
jgi:tetratricopeptide (TPR) repeat protein